ncbi:sodium/solute symporter [Nocardioides bruguierae]|uniref:Cation acetate symporter n=1 Tax=Nocardioides bruguierae TaxID=2945102 RepID=A0A9X2IEE2_9ACTN|nr:cation acetate symporter [Nocardioides bruguierae]MCM0620736.1 cation acetate symporter [Nocardioides bruguierae]
MSGAPVWPGAVAVALVVVATLAIGSLGLRLSRTTSDFMVASRTVPAFTNASAISGEYLSAASFLGVAGLLLTFGADMLWYPVGWTAGYLVMLALVSAPLRRSGAYTLPDFAEARLGSRRVRTICSVLVVAVGWLYLLPLFQGAGVMLGAALGLPTWIGPAGVASVVLVNVIGGGMRSITLVQAVQYWFKLTALLLPAAVLLAVWLGDGRPDTERLGRPDFPTDVLAWSNPLADGGAQGLYLTYALIAATFFGTMGLPHVVVRFYTNPDGRSARRSTLLVLALLGLFYLVPPVYGALGRVYAPELAASGESDLLVLLLPRIVVPGLGGDLLTGLVVAGAFAAFLSTSSGLAIAVAGVLGQDVTGRSWGGRRLGGVAAFRLGAVIAVVVPAAVALGEPSAGVATTVGLAFAVAASTFAPLLMLGIWWRRLTPTGAGAGLVVGGLGSGAAALTTLYLDGPAGWVGVLAARPALWSIPLATAVMMLVSLATQRTVPPGVRRFMVRLHTPEALDLDRG